MAADAVRHGARAKNASRAAKERREKIGLVAGVVILAGLLALEGPKTLKALHGSKAQTAPAPAVMSPSVPATAPTAPAVARPVDLSRLRGYAQKDPFVPQLAAVTGQATGDTLVTPPFVRSSHFVAKDPFVQQLTVAGPTTTTTKNGRTHVVAQGAYIVMLASVYVGHGRGEADRAAAAAKRRGVPNVGIVLSNDYPTLRTGFYAVYSGPYPTLDKALAMLQTIRGRGYVSAYTRRLAR